MSVPGNASFSTAATNYGRNSADAYYYLSAPDTVNGPLTITGDLTVNGSSTLTGPVSAGSTLAVAGAVTTGSTLNTAGNIVAGGSANATITAAGPSGSVQLNPVAGGFPSVLFTNGAANTLVGLQTPTNLLVGNNGVSVGMPGDVNVGGVLSAGGNIRVVKSLTLNTTPAAEPLGQGYFATAQIGLDPKPQLNFNCGAFLVPQDVSQSGQTRRYVGFFLPPTEWYSPGTFIPVEETGDG
jgi:hypothetical protein